MKRKTTIVKDINKLFPPSNPKYPICFLRDRQVVVSAETTAVEVLQGENFDILVADYYDAPPSWEFGIHPKLHEYAKRIDRYWEWYDPGSIVLSEF